MLHVRTSLAEYLIRLQTEGRVSFTRDEATAALGLTLPAFLKAAERLQKKRLLFSPRHGFYVVVPAQYLPWGAPPPSWYIDDLMRHEGRPYYVGLLKAAELHGATHHAVMEFQVITDKQLPKIRAGRSLIAFYYRKDLSAVQPGIHPHKTDTGSMKLSSPELTALDLLRYAHASGGIDSIATVLSDLKDRLDAEKLAKMAEHFERAFVQRLGWMLDRLGASDKTQALHSALQAKRPVPWITLEPQRRGWRKHSGEPLARDERWRVIVFREPEIDS